MKSKKNLFTLFSMLAAMFVLSLLTATSVQAQGARSFSGDATGVIANANVLGVVTADATIAPTGALPGAGGRRTNGVLQGDAAATIQLGSLGSANTLSTGVVTTRTSGGPAGIVDGGNNNTSQSRAVVNDLNLNIAAATFVNTGLTVTATTITATTACTCGPNCAGTSTIENLRVNGLILGSGAGQLPFVVVSGMVTVAANGNVTASPNSQITVTLLNGSTVDLFLNEQTSAGAGDITVNALRIQANLGLLGNILTTNIIVAQAHSDITCAPTGVNLGSFTVNKDFCARLVNNTCNGKPNTFPNNVLFTVEQGTYTGGNFTSDGTTFPNIIVNINGNAKGATTTSDIFTAGNTYRVCEIPPPGFTPLPRPGATTGGSSQFTDSTSCIVITKVNSGNNVLNFLNLESTTAAGAGISGRVLTERGRGISRATVTVLDTNTLESRTVRTNPFGYFNMQEMPVGDFYIISVNSKGYWFANNNQGLTLTENLTNLQIIGTPFYFGNVNGQISDVIPK